MRPIELAHVVIDSRDPAQWAEFATDVLGAMPVPGPADSIRLRLDERSARVVVVPAEADNYRAAGWLAASEAVFAGLRERLTDAGVTVRPGTDEEKELRRVLHLFSFDDPAGNVHEVVCGPVAEAPPFVSPQGTHFATGADGMGHVVLPSHDRLDAVTAFWTDVMGLTRANSRTFPNGARGSFFSCNDRQHSMAITELDCPRGCLHIALEVTSLDDVGRTLDRATERKLVRRALGKHLNDNMVSFYMETPGGFQLEYGYSDGVPTWQPGTYFEDSGGSYWGHAFLD
ncbi:VOC family protein [Pseudonocardia benzenivorans]|uniref:VOC family protein n=1 Tax=Pseudonocardia benzenivorans TaxID=228005 RepID=A0ABW3VTP4_9PSEU